MAETILKTMVVGFDGSETARRAVAESARLAGATGAALHVVNVLDDEAARQGLTLAEQDEAVAQVASIATEQLTVGELGELLASLDVTHQVLSGAPADTLLRYADLVSADLIVVGNRRVQGITRLLGSVAVEVLRNARCSVYVAHTS